MNLALGLPLTGASVILLNSSYYGQHASSATLPKLSLRQPIAALRALVTSAGWMTAYVVGLVGWVAYVAALGFAPLSIVQALSASGVGFIALVHRLRGERLSQQERLGAAASMIGLVLVIVSLQHLEAPRTPSEVGLLVIVGCGLALAGAVAVLPPTLLTRGAALGATSGICFGIGDVATKGALGGSGLALVAVLLACYAIGFIASQLAYQRGTVFETAGLSTLLTNAIPIAIGVLVFDERPPTGALGVLRVAGFAFALVGGVLLARTPTLESTD